MDIECICRNITMSNVGSVAFCVEQNEQVRCVVEAISIVSASTWYSYERCKAAAL